MLTIFYRTFAGRSGRVVRKFLNQELATAYLESNCDKMDIATADLYNGSFQEGRWQNPRWV